MLLLGELNSNQPNIQSQENENTVELLSKLSIQETRVKELESQLQLERFGLQRFTNDDSMIQFYTGFPSYSTLTCFYEFIAPSAQNIQSAYYVPSETTHCSGRPRCMQLIDEFFLFLCKLRVGLLDMDLAVRFNCSLPTISRKIITWANFLYFVLGSIPFWLPRCEVQRLMPDCFRENYPRTRVIIDCTEIRTQHPASLVANSMLFSSYKGTNTLKCLIGIAPHGVVTFVSSLYTGCISDVELFKLCGLLNLLDENDDVMADKGFTIKSLLQSKQVTLNIPAFLSAKRQFSPSEVSETERIASLRIHIERVNRRIKEFHFFDSPVPLNLLGSVNQLWTVCTLLTNFQGPIVKKF